MQISSHCRLCAGGCAVVADVDQGRLLRVAPSPHDPLAAGLPCGVLDASVAALRAPGRVLQPLRREGGRLVPVDADAALDGISDALRALRRSAGAGAIGLYLGDDAPRRSASTLAALAFGVGMGTPRIFSGQAWGQGPALRATELMLGHPAWLLGDLGRAHHVVLFDGDQDDAGFGPGLAGREHLQALRHSRKTKGAKVVVVGPRRTALAAEMDQHVAIRAGTEPYFLLGMLVAVVKGGWRDAQYVRDYTDGYEALARALEPWSVEALAAVCGVPAATLSGVALKFSRAAMGVVHPSASTFANPQALLGAWAWLALHTVTANTLRPGGLFDHAPPLDIQPLVAQLPTAGAPEVAGLPLQLLQASGAALADAAADAADPLQALIMVGANPQAALPREAQAALRGLGLKIALATELDASAALADWVLPLTHPWEETELHLLDSPLTHHHLARRSPALVDPAGGARPAEAWLRAIFARVRPGIRGGPYGLHLKVAARALLAGDAAAWARRAADWGLDGGEAVLEAPPHRVDGGPADRSLQRLGFDDRRIRLLPDEIGRRLAVLQLPSAEGLVLRTSGRSGRAPDALHGAGPAAPVLRVHPDRGIPDGGRARLRTAAGELVVEARHDPALHPEVLDLHVGAAGEGRALVPAGLRDPDTGTPALDGLSVTLEPAAG